MAEPRDIFEALFIGDDVDQGEIAASMRATQSDDELRGLFDALAYADREVGGDFEARAGEAMFLAALDDMLEEEQSQKVVSLADRRRPAPARWAVAAAAVLAVGASLVMFARPSEPEFQARSAATGEAKKYETPAVEVFCVERDDAGEVTFRGAESSELATVTCPVGSEVKFATRNPDGRLGYVALVGVADDGTPRWYGPSPAAPDALSVPAGSDLAPLGETIRLDVNHDPGTVRVVGIFSEKPMSWSDVETWTKENAGALRDGKLTVADGAVVRMTFEVTP